jgi:hypothetical protein
VDFELWCVMVAPDWNRNRVLLEANKFSKQPKPFVLISHANPQYVAVLTRKVIGKMNPVKLQKNFHVSKDISFCFVFNVLVEKIIPLTT